jgi:uncharacterized protein (UPF0261 family)
LRCLIGFAGFDGDELVESAALELPMLIPKVIVGLADPADG